MSMDPIPKREALSGILDELENKYANSNWDEAIELALKLSRKLAS